MSFIERSEPGAAGGVAAAAGEALAEGATGAVGGVCACTTAVAKEARHRAIGTEILKTPEVKAMKYPEIRNS